MNFIDLIIVIPIIYFSWIGFKKGFIVSLFTLLALIIGLYVGIHFSYLLNDQIHASNIVSYKYEKALSIAIIFILTAAGVYFLGILFQKILKTLQLNIFNKLGGLVFGLLKAILIIGFLLSFLETIDHKEHMITIYDKKNSILYAPTKNICSILLPEIKDNLLPTLNEQIKSNFE